MNGLRACAWWAGIALAGLLVGCTDAEIFETPGLGKGQQDNKLEVRGSFCTEHPDELNFPVKIMFIIDCSQSTAVTDPPPSPNEYPGRVRAVWDVIQQFRFEPGVSFAILRFEGAANVATQRDTNGDGVADQFGFVNDLAALLRALLSLQSSGGNTSYQAALALAEATLAMDMSTTSVEERGRTKYVVIFLSDGLPYPVDYNEEINTPFSIKRSLTEMMALPDRFEVADFQFHTAFLSVDTPAYVVAQAESLLKGMAEIGNGTYRNFQNGEEINFLDIDYTSVKRMYSVKSGAFMVSNANAHPSWSRTESVDTDGDGVVDLLEEELGTDPGAIDTDGDGFNDLLEYNLRRSGFDPLDEDDADCRLALDRLDRDGDGLLDCEERFLGTSPDLFDTDADGAPDPIEVKSGTNPVWNDGSVDMDFDGSLNGSEVAWHTNPTSNDAALLSKLAYRYQLSKRPGVFESRQCYDFNVANISLMGTRPRSEGALEGFNDIMVYVGQVPYDDPSDYGTFRVACARARYIPRHPEADIKFPANGVIRFEQKDFKRPVATPCTSEAECPYHVCDPRNHVCLAPLGDNCDPTLAVTGCPHFACETDPITSQQRCVFPVETACLQADDCPPFPLDEATGTCMDPARSLPDAASGLCPRRECVPQYPLCTTTANCTADGDTTPDNDPVCMDGFCRVPCFSAAGCNPGETCDPDPEIECATAADCPDAAAQCVANVCRITCAVSADCPAATDTCENTVCVSHHCEDHHGGTCAALACVSDADCPLQPCDEEVGRCRVQPCLDSRDCPHQACEMVVGKCLGTTCASDLDCRGDRGYTCNQVFGDPCVRDIDCPFDFCSGVAHKCYFGNGPCALNTDCTPNTCTGGMACTGSGNRCSTSADCDTGETCSPTCNLSHSPCALDGDCNPNFCSSYSVCINDPSISCRVSLDCGKPSFCVVDPASGNHCLNDPGIACNPATENIDNLCQVGMCARDQGLGTCDTVIGESCETDADCPPYQCNLAANPPACLYPNEVACDPAQNGADCPVAGMACQAGFCIKFCSTDSECPNAFCQGRCVPMDPANRMRCTDWFDPDRDCQVFGDSSSP